MLVRKTSETKLQKSRSSSSLRKSLEQIEQAITLIAGRSRIECSGNIDMTTISRFRGLAIDYVSSGSLTHSAKSLDFSMKGLTYLDV
ncbi:nicotinate-nucleotide pyrophosphorylase [Streptococcus pneumoniae]|nr:nicotinate-nucleotide pyrophosphorylase [Streptococcus pneumoniae]